MGLRYKDGDGAVHFRAPHTPEYFLCGLAMDGENFTGSARTTEDKVNCPNCIDVVEFCKHDVRRHREYSAA